MEGQVSEKAAQAESGWAGLGSWVGLVHSAQPEGQLSTFVHTLMADLSLGIGIPWPVKKADWQFIHLIVRSMSAIELRTPSAHVWYISPSEPTDIKVVDEHRWKTKR